MRGRLPHGATGAAPDARRGRIQQSAGALALRPFVRRRFACHATHASMIFFSPRSRQFKAASSSAFVSSDGLSSPASNAAALSWLKSSGRTLSESSST